MMSHIHVPIPVDAPLDQLFDERSIKDLTRKIVWMQDRGDLPVHFIRVASF